MYVVDVIPISRGIGKEKLSYFSKVKLLTGSIVEVPLHKRTVSAIVLKSHDAAELKSELKSLEFELKKIKRVKTGQFFLEGFLEAVNECAEYFAATSGSVLNCLAPAKLLKFLAKHTHSIQANKSMASNKHYDRLMLQADDEERFAHYKSLIREEFARKHTVYMCLPTIQEIKTARLRLEKGIEEFTIVLYAAMSGKELAAAYETILKNTHPLLIIGTGAHLAMPRHDVGAIILERESSRAYKSLARPYLDYRVFANFLARHIGARILYGDSALSAERIYEYREHTLHELSPLKFRSLTPANMRIADMRVYKSNQKNFTILGDDVKALLTEAKTENQHVFLYAARRGLSPQTLCGDCGTIVRCHICNRQIVLHASREAPFFLCHSCGKRRDAKETCSNCGSWKLVTFGIGIERVHLALKVDFPNFKIFRLDRDTVRTHKRALEVVERFYSTPGSVLLGTEQALHYTNEKIGYSAVVSLDSLLSVPDFRMHEKIFSLLIRMRSLTERHIIIQTRNPEERIFDFAAKGNLADFYREELDVRQKFRYPPFTTLIKISLDGERRTLVDEMAKVKELFDEYQLEIFPSFTRSRTGRSLLHALLRLDESKWPDLKLLGLLRQLPPKFNIEVDPDSLL